MPCGHHIGLGPSLVGRTALVAPVTFYRGQQDSLHPPQSPSQTVAPGRAEGYAENIGMSHLLRPIRRLRLHTDDGKDKGDMGSGEEGDQTSD